MTYFTKLILSSVPYNDVVSFIEKSNKKITTLTTEITYRTNGDFCYMLEKRKEDNTIINLEVFYLSDHSITGIFTGYRVHTENALCDNNDIFFRSITNRDQNMNLHIVDGNAMPNIVPGSKVNIRVSAIGDKIISIPSIETLLNDTNSMEYINRAVLQKENSVVSPIGFIRCMNDYIPVDKFSTLAKRTIIIGKVVDVRIIKLKIKNETYNTVVYEINTPFLGNIDIVDIKPIRSTVYEIGSYIYVQSNEIIGTFLPFHPTNKIEYTPYEYLSFIANRIKNKESLEKISDFIDNNAKTYWNGILIGSSKKMLIEFIHFYNKSFSRYQTTLREDTNPICTKIVECKNDDELIKDYWSYFANDRGKKNALKKWNTILKENNDDSISKRKTHVNIDYYKQFEGKDSITLIGKTSKVAFESILLTYSATGKINSLELNEFPIFSLTPINSTSNITNLNENVIPMDTEVRKIKYHKLSLRVLHRLLTNPFSKDDSDLSYELYTTYAIYIDSIFNYLRNYTPTSKNLSYIFSLPFDDNVSIFLSLAANDNQMYNASFVFAIPYAMEYFYELGQKIKKSAVLAYPKENAECVAIRLVKKAESDNENSYEPFVNNKGMRYVYDEMKRLLPLQDSSFLESIEYEAMLFLRLGYQSIDKSQK